MQTKLRFAGMVVATLAAAACGKTVDPPPPSGLPGEPPTEAVSPLTITDYVLDFTSSKAGGVLAGRFTHVAFNLDRSAHRRAFALEALTDQAVPGVVQSNDFASCDNRQAATMLERTATTLEPGEASYIDHVDIEMLVPKGTEWKGGVCFGTRSPAGWKWSFKATAMSYEAASDRYRARIPVQQGPVDAFKIAFDEATVPEQPITKITVAMRPPG